MTRMNIVTDTYRESKCKGLILCFAGGFSQMDMLECTGAGMY